MTHQVQPTVGYLTFQPMDMIIDEKEQAEYKEKSTGAPIQEVMAYYHFHNIGQPCAKLQYFSVDWSRNYNLLSESAIEFIHIIQNYNTATIIAPDNHKSLNHLLFQKRCNIFLLQVFILTNKFKNLFKIFDQPWTNYIRKYDSMLIEKNISFFNLNYFLGTLSSYPLLQRYIWRHKKLWKPLLHFLIKLLMDKHLKIGDELVFSTILQLFARVKYRRNRHFIYLVNNGFSDCIENLATKCWQQNRKVIVNCYNKSNGRHDNGGYDAMILNSFDANSGRYKESENIMPFYIEIQKNKVMIQIFVALNSIFRKCKKKGNLLFFCINPAEEYVIFSKKLKSKLYSTTHCKNKCEMLFRMYVYWQLFVNDKITETYLRSKHIGYGRTHCEWKYCKQTKKTKKLYRCKGCQLVTYCCKSHQKKHWKTIHSKQCLRH
eukprot:34415_1